MLHKAREVKVQLKIDVTYSATSTLLLDEATSGGNLAIPGHGVGLALQLFSTETELCGLIGGVGSVKRKEKY